jgi:hypothetical protein
VSRVYVYAFVDMSLPLASIEGRTIEIVDIEQIHAAIERSADAPSLSEDALRRQHAIVQRLARRVNAIVPVRFGAVLDESELAEIVRLRAGALREALAHVRGRVQMTVRMLLDSSGATAERPGRPRPTSGTAYLLERRASAVRSRPATMNIVCDAVRTMVCDERTDLDPASGHAVVAHLIERADVRRYRARTASFAREMPGRITVTGPWAPFAFAPRLWP